MNAAPQIYAPGRLTLDRGGALDNARLVYRTYGSLNAARDNVIVMPTYYTGTHDDNARLIGPDGILDPNRYFIVVPNLFGNGLSTSPSNAYGPGSTHDREREHPPDAAFPTVTLYDNVRCQYRLLNERYGVERIRLVLGWSMGAQQAFHWAAAYPDAVDAILPWCGSAKTSVHNYVFLEGVKAALTADPIWAGGRYREPPVAGLKAFGRVYAGWAYSQAFWRERRYRELGFASADALLAWWEQDHLGWDANNLLAMLHSWQHADIGADARYGGDAAVALAAIHARAIIMPCLYDLYFPPEDSLAEVALMQHAEYRPIDSVWGHAAGSPGRLPTVTTQLRVAVNELLHN